MATNYTLSGGSGSVTITASLPTGNIFEADYGSGTWYLRIHAGWGANHLCFRVRISR